MAKDIIGLIKKQKNLSMKGLGSQYDNTRMCYALYNATESDDYVDVVQFVDTDGRKRKATVNFGGIQSNVDAVVGFMAQNRRVAKAIARVHAPELQRLYSQNTNALLAYHRENTNSEQLETLMDASMMIAGYAAMDTDLTYVMGASTKTPGGEIAKKFIEPENCYWDASKIGKNMLDARWVGYYEDFDLEDALSLFQGSDEEDFEHVGDEEDAGGYQFNPYGGKYDKIKIERDVEWTDAKRELVRVYNHQWISYETFYRTYNPIFLAETPEDAQFFKVKMEALIEEMELVGPEGMETEDMFELRIQDEEISLNPKQKKMFDAEFGDIIKAVPFKRKVYNTAIFSGDHIFTTFRSLSQQGFTIKFKTGIYNKTGKYWTGMVNGMAEPKKYRDKAMTEMMFAIAANSKGGVMVEKGAVEDIADFEKKWAKTDGVIVVEDGAIQQGKIKQKAIGAVPTGLEGLISLCDVSMRDAGVDPAFLGEISGPEQSGMLYKRRIRQVISKLAQYFDSITLFQKEDTRLMLDLLRVWVMNNLGAYVRINGEEGQTEYMQMSQDTMTAEYDVDIQEAPQTAEEKQEMALLLASYADRVMAINPTAAMGILAESLSFVNVDSDVANRIRGMLQPQQEKIDPAQVQAMMAELQQLKSEANQAEVAKKQADAAYSMARAESTKVNNQLILAKVPETQANTALKLEEAARTAAEAAIAEKTEPQKSTVIV